MDINEEILFSEEIHGSEVKLTKHFNDGQFYFNGKLINSKIIKYFIKINGKDTHLLNMKMESGSWNSKLREEDNLFLDAMAKEVYSHLCKRLKESQETKEFLHNYNGESFDFINNYFKNSEITLRSELDFDSEDYTSLDALKIYLYNRELPY